MNQKLVNFLREFIVEELHLELFKRRYLNEAETQQINLNQAIDLIEKSKGRIFTVVFKKRSDGSERVMNARLGVKKYLKGGTLPYDADAKNLLPVFDLKKNAYRMINKDSITTLKIGNTIYTVR